MLQIPADAKGVLFVVSTSHMDWHWHSTFEQYYTMGSESDGHYPVRQILDQVRILLPSPGQVPVSNRKAPRPTPDNLYKYNLAEVAWLRRYLQDNPEWVKDLVEIQGYFSFIGGGITSPDSLDTNGEVFIRTYLIGRNYIREKNLGHLITNTCWVPDDFGTDPQLPVVLQAMGLTSVSFARVPGWQPAGSGNYAANPSDQNQSLQLAKNGVTFQWLAADGSTVLANYMLCIYQNPAYGYPWNQDGATADNLNSFITQNNYPDGTGSTFPVNQPGLIMMTPSGGDFAMPSLDLLNAVQDYNENYYPPTGSNYNNTGVYAVMASFEDFADYVMARVKKQTLSLQKLQGWNAAENGFDPTSYWTGHFANYVQIKINQQRAANRLMAAETLSTLLRAYSYLSNYLLDGLDNMITGAWNDLVQSSHHDYVTGTAPTSIYQQEQLPLISQALRQAEASLDQGMGLLAASVNASPLEKEIPYVVFNPAGTARTLTGIVEIPATPALALMNSYRIDNDNSSHYYAIQRTAENKILIQISDLGSMGYTVVYFSPNAPSHPTILIPQKPEDNNGIYLNNGVVQIAIDKGTENGWAINSIIVIKDQTEMAQGLCNRIQAYSEGTQGNPYQMGNELDSDGFKLAQSPSYTIGKGNILEAGPYRWRFLGEMTNTPTPRKGESLLQMEYILELNDPLIRMRVTGNAAANTATSVVTTWRLKNAPSDPPAMSYGTANHWNGPNFTPYWSGPVFRSTHDFVTVSDASNPSGAPLCAMYHEGMRAWAYSNSQLMGILLRNTNDNGGRGASNADPDCHTQQYAFRIPGINGPESCQPLQESVQFQMPLVAMAIPATNSGIAQMTPSGNLAGVIGNAILRMARTQPGSGGAPTNEMDANAPMPFSFVLRIYQPGNTTSGSWTVNIPFINNNSGGDPVISQVTALEEAIPFAAPINYENGMIILNTLQTLTTLQIQSWGPLIIPTNP